MQRSQGQQTPYSIEILELEKYEFESYLSYFLSVSSPAAYILSISKVQFPHILNTVVIF